MVMATQERMYTVDDVLRLEQAPRHPAEKYYLIDGELFVKMAPTEIHGKRQARLRGIWAILWFRAVWAE